ncbi:bax Inhibitor-1 [Arctopsyche grandis]|uniref:bax Inhibitor-1 n=1 Tax=Arctopsyche grandis TaxID=121162 RepID=UPI00406D7C9E
MTPTVTGFMNSFNNRLEEPVRAHLKNVYACLTMTSISASAGAFLDIYTDWFKAGFISNIGALGLIFMLMYTPDNGKNIKQRLAYLLGFGFLSGMGIGPLLQYAIMLNPAIVTTALAGTCLIFVSFTIASMLADRGRWLFLGGTLMTLLTTIAALSLANIFFRSQLLYQTHLYLGLALMCGFILYDTQAIIEKRRAGNKDFVGHSLDLFLDFIGVMRRLVIILTQKEEQDRRRKRD